MFEFSKNLIPSKDIASVPSMQKASSSLHSSHLLAPQMPSLLIPSTTIEGWMKPLYTGLSGYWHVVDDVVIFDIEEDKNAAPVQFCWTPVVPGWIQQCYSDH